jgi:peptidoglycan/LPS O-acetylase OafA/YrhL
MLYRWRAGTLTRAGAAALALALGVTLLGRGDFAQIVGPTYFAAACMMAASLAWASGIGNQPSLRVAANLGQISYPLYLVHCTLANLALLAGSVAGIAPPVSVGVSIVLSLGLSWLIHVRLERPLQSLYRAQLRGAVAPGATLAYGR